MTIRSGVKLAFLSALCLLTASCGGPQKATVGASGVPTKKYEKMGIIPVYEAELRKRTPPGLITGGSIEHIDLDVGLNSYVVDRTTSLIGSKYKIFDLQRLAREYIGTPKVHRWEERKIFNDNRPLFTDVVKSIVVNQSADAYILVDGGPVWLYEPQVAPAIQLLAAQGHNLFIQATVYVIDGKTFEVVAKYSSDLVLNVPGTWFVAPKQHGEEIKAAATKLLEQSLPMAFQTLGLL